MNDASQNLPLNIIQAATLIKIITYYDKYGNVIDISGYTADMQFRSNVEATGDPIIEASTYNGLIIINGTLGTITISIPSTTTAMLLNGQLMVYNLFITSPGGVVTPLLAGQSIVQGSAIK